MPHRHHDIRKWCVVPGVGTDDVLCLDLILDDITTQLTAFITENSSVAWIHCHGLNFSGAKETLNRSDLGATKRALSLDVFFFRPHEPLYAFEAYEKRPGTPDRFFYFGVTDRAFHFFVEA